MQIWGSEAAAVRLALAMLEKSAIRIIASPDGTRAAPVPLSIENSRTVVRRSGSGSISDILQRLYSEREIESQFSDPIGPRPARVLDAYTTTDEGRAPSPATSVSRDLLVPGLQTPHETGRFDMSAPLAVAVPALPSIPTSVPLEFGDWWRRILDSSTAVTTSSPASRGPAFARVTILVAALYLLYANNW